MQFGASVAESKGNLLLTASYQKGNDPKYFHTGGLYKLNVHSSFLDLKHVDGQTQYVFYRVLFGLFMSCNPVVDCI